MAKQLMLHSPCMEKVLFRIIYTLDDKSVAKDIREHHGWFYELVDSIGVRFCGNSLSILSFTDFYEIDMDQVEYMDQEMEEWIRLLYKKVEEVDLNPLVEKLRFCIDEE
jgi:hypothetical protein